jgi:SAM-dependent methyltransferase
VQRTLEPELMTGEQSARAYAEADFTGPNQAFCGWVEPYARGLPEQARVVDLGSGPGDIAVRLGRAHPGWQIDGVDGSPAMLAHAERARARAGLGERVRWICARLPSNELPRQAYHLSLSNSLLHHLPDPNVLWESLLLLTRAGGTVVVMDLIRPETPEAAWKLVETYSPGEPKILKMDFFHSLCAAFRPSEVRDQLDRLGLEQLTVQEVSDRHWLVAGRLVP